MVKHKLITGKVENALYLPMKKNDFELFFLEAIKLGQIECLYISIDSMGQQWVMAFDMNGVHYKNKN